MPTHSGLAGPSMPRYLTSFVGRQQEIADITALLLRDDVRLLTLIGPGGAGKTRLAIEVVNRLEDDAWEKIWFVPLVAVRDPAFVLPAIAQALGLNQITGRSIDQIIVHFLGDKRALLLLDNLEHLADAAPDLGQVLVACPAVTLLATSRVALRISGEHLLAIRPLETPGSTAIPLDKLRGIESVQLFLQRASASDRGVVLTPENAAAISQICQRLDGLPLALELAAARCAMLTPTALNILLEQGSSMLSDGPRDLHERHRSLYDAIAWSYDLLPEGDQAVFRRLAVFNGKFSLEAARAVVGLPVDMLATLAAFVSQSLVVPERANGPEPRFTMLETLREFGLERLEEAGESASTRDRHARFYADEARLCHYAWVQPLEEGLRQFRLLEADQANLWEALAWLHQSSHLTLCLRMAADLVPHSILFGHMDEEQAWLERLLADERINDAPLRARALTGLSWLLSHHGDFEKALRLANEGIALLQGLDEPLLIMDCVGLSGVAAHNLRDFDVAREREEEAVRLARSMPDPPAWMENSIQLPLMQLGHIALDQGLIHEAERRFMEVLHLQVSRGYEPGHSHIQGYSVLAGLGQVARAKGDHAQALRLFQQFLELAWQHGTPIVAIYAINEVAGTLSLLGQYEHASRLFGATESLEESYSVRYSGHNFMREVLLEATPPLPRTDDLPSLRTFLQIKSKLHSRGRVGPETVDAAWTRGRALSLDAAVTDALSATVEPVPPACPKALDGLTPREIEVLQLVTDGHSNRAIAETLSLSERTIEHHVRHILAKLDLGSRAAAAAYAVRHNLG